MQTDEEWRDLRVELRGTSAFKDSRGKEAHRANPEEGPDS